MAITLSSTFANLVLQHSGTSLLDQILGGALVIYSGTPPTGANEALSGNTALATFTFDSTSGDYSAPSSGVLSLKFGSNVTSPTVTASATGTATFFRILNTTPAALIQGTVGVSGADFNLSSTTITSGDNVSITGTATITLAVT